MVTTQAVRLSMDPTDLNLNLHFPNGDFPNDQKFKNVRMNVKRDDCVGDVKRKMVKNMNGDYKIDDWDLYDAKDELLIDDEALLLDCIKSTIFTRKNITFQQ